jgi:putative ABC transport system ATP-binding protein
MELFKELNRRDHATIFLVTHDPEVVPYCTRLVRIRDGAITEDKAVIEE